MAVEALVVGDLQIPWETRTLEGFRKWAATLDENGPRVSFVQGRLHVEVSPQSYDTHEPLVGAVNTTLRRLARESDLGRYFLPPSWFTHEATALSTEPDGFFALWTTLEHGILRVNPNRRTEMLGRPDMILEAVSKTSEHKDTIELVSTYAAAGVPEYWIADARGETLTFRLLVLDDRQQYVERVAAADEWVHSPIWDRRFRLRRFVDRVGMTDFELEVQPA